MTIDPGQTGSTARGTGDNLAGNADLRASQSDRKIIALKRRLVREATTAISMLENALAALWTLDVEAAAAVRAGDDTIDSEEVAIEQECLELLALRAPYARDFRLMAFVLKVNADIERVADHACSVAKIVSRIRSRLGDAPPPAWPTALMELGQRVPAMCHELLRAVLDEDVDAAQAVLAGDEVIDQLDRRLFDEAIELTRRLSGGPRTDNDIAIGMLIYRAGRELERVGDLMSSIGEELVYLATGKIIRHQKKRNRSTGPA